MVNLTIDGIAVQVEDGTSILDAAESVNCHIPTLCYLKDITDIGACRVCLVEVEGVDQLVAACNNICLEGMVVHTNSPKVRSARKTNVELLLSEHDIQCTNCARGGNCQLQQVANDLGILNVPYQKYLFNAPWPMDFPLIRDGDKCIKCMRCVNVCRDIQTLGVWDLINHANRATVGVADGKLIENTHCALCAQCVTHCPTGALTVRDDTDKVFEALADPETITIVQIAPSVRTAWAEQLGLPHDQATANRLVAALRKIGFDYVFDTDFSADLTIMEEGSEFLDRYTHKENKMPLFTSCCPGWVRFLKGEYPDMVDQLSTSKSPQGMFGAVIKSYLPTLDPSIDPDKICSISIMPCLAKKHECAIPCLDDAGHGPDVDIVLTTREIARMIREEQINVSELEESEFDMPLGLGTGAGVIFGATGGVMEAALRSAYFMVTGENPEPDAFKDVRGLKGWKEGTFQIADNTVRVAVASGLGNARALVEALRAGKVQYDFVEIMACPGGCAGGGGQIIQRGKEMAGERGALLYKLDEGSTYRFSHDNPSIKLIYENFLGQPLSEMSEKLLHTDQHAWTMPGEED